MGPLGIMSRGTRKECSMGGERELQGAFLQCALLGDG